MGKRWVPRSHRFPDKRIEYESDPRMVPPDTRQLRKSVGWAESSRPTKILLDRCKKVGLEDSADPTSLRKASHDAGIKLRRVLEGTNTMTHGRRRKRVVGLRGSW